MIKQDDGPADKREVQPEPARNVGLERTRDVWEYGSLYCRQIWDRFEDSVSGRSGTAWTQLSRFWNWICERPLALRWTSVFLSVSLATLVGVSFRSQVTVGSSLMLFLPAVLVSALYGGQIAGLAAALLGASATIHYFIGVPHSESGKADIVSLGLYGLVCGIMLAFSSAQQRHRVQMRELASSLERRVEMRAGQARAAHEELAGFCYSISHDLRAPMRNLIGSSRILVEEESSRLSEESVARLRSMAASAGRLSHLVDDLLGYARLSGADLVPEWVDLTRMAEGNWSRLMSRRWPFVGAELRVHPGLVAAADRGLLGLALHSMLENACKYSKPGQFLVVEVGETRRNGCLSFFVRDNGIGFDPQYSEKIFEPFQRLHRDTDYPGTGIGLANVRRIVERHGGEIVAEGQLGRGSNFTFWLGGLALGGPELGGPELGGPELGGPAPGGGFGGSAGQGGAAASGGGTGLPPVPRPNPGSFASIE